MILVGCIAAISVGAAVSVTFSLNSGSLSDLQLANIEAIAGCESPVETKWGISADLECPMEGGGTAKFKGCDFDDGYRPRECTGRSR